MKEYIDPEFRELIADGDYDWESEITDQGRDRVDLPRLRHTRDRRWRDLQSGAEAAAVQFVVEHWPDLLSVPDECSDWEGYVAVTDCRTRLADCWYYGFFYGRLNLGEEVCAMELMAANAEWLDTAKRVIPGQFAPKRLIEACGAGYRLGARSRDMRTWNAETSYLGSPDHYYWPPPR
jgi:hypothetical protein